MRDELCMNKLTGELLPAMQAISQYCKEHPEDIYGTWTNEWEPTGMDADTYIAPPDFTKAFNF